MYCEHNHLTREGNFYVCQICGAYFEMNEIDKEDIAKCVECGTDYLAYRDIQLCDNCLDEHDLDRLWHDHDNGKLDALDFNENKEIRDRYRLKRS